MKKLTYMYQPMMTKMPILFQFFFITVLNAFVICAQAKDNTDIDGGLLDAIKRVVVIDKKYRGVYFQANFPKDYAFNNGAEQEVLTRIFIEDGGIYNLLEKYFQGYSAGSAYSMYAAEDHLRYMIRQGSFFALALFRSDLDYLPLRDGEMSSFGFGRELYPYQLFPNYGSIIKQETAEKSAQYFCETILLDPEQASFFLDGDYMEIYDNIKKNGVTDFIDAVDDMKWCTDMMNNCRLEEGDGGMRPHGKCMKTLNKHFKWNASKQHWQVMSNGKVFSHDFQ